MIQLRALRLLSYALVFFAGLAALSWEVLWQLQSSLALGISARGTAIALAGTMSGMTLGSLLAGRLLRRTGALRPLRIYGLMELSIGLFGQLLLPGFHWIGELDASVYRSTPGLAPLVEVVAIVLLIWPPAMAMGATIPLFGLISQRLSSSVSRLYGFNTAGAAIGTLTLAFVFLPELGVSISIGLLSTLNVLLGLAAIMASRAIPEGAVEHAPADVAPAAVVVEPSGPREELLAFGTGFATFAFEVIWFRALRSSFGSTTESFAIMLAAVLIPIALAAHVAPILVRRGTRPGPIVAIAAILLLLSTPVVERLDYLWFGGNVLEVSVMRFLASIAVLGLPVFTLALVFPVLLERRKGASGWARLYAENTLGALAGSLATAWLVLPTLGLIQSAWLLASLLAILGLVHLEKKPRLIFLGATIAALLVAVFTQTGVGGLRIIAQYQNEPYTLVEVREGPDATVAVTEVKAGSRVLFIDGFVTTSELKNAGYMRWMGTLPMILHEDPKNALVICFGTGQTADGVRQENPQALDIVDLNGVVFEMAPHFVSNQGVLQDARVRTIVMDGRAWLRRSDRTYDVITLEPMPPNFAGVNALYSKEFYELAAERMSPSGIIAQWLPIHLVDPFDALSIAATFRSVFPDGVLWMDPVGRTGILLGRRNMGGEPLGTEWPGLTRQPEGRSLDAESIKRAVALDPVAFAAYAAAGVVITDDNQQLAYGWARLLKGDQKTIFFSNFELVKKARHGKPLL